MKSTKLKTIVSLAAILSAPTAAWSQIFAFDFEVESSIPDDTSTGIADIQTLQPMESRIESVSIRLELSAEPGFSGFLGDLYAYIEHAGRIAVLLNRPGRTLEAPFGYADNQALDVRFSDTGPDVHVHRPLDGTPLSGPLTGTFTPDGRATDPALVLDTDARTLFLDAFTGLPADGEWTLFLADLSGGGRHRLVGWSLELELAEIPELPVFIPAAGLVATGWFLRRHRKARKPTSASRSLL